MAAMKDHWESVYHSKEPESVSWYQKSLFLSLELIRATDIPKDAAIVDVGGGASTLVDDLLALEYSNIMVLDISEEALHRARSRLGPNADSVRWITADITAADPTPLGCDLWHDRAVFHFLVKEEDRRKYCDLLNTSLSPGGFAVIATFGPGGPATCSGLEIVRYDPKTLLLTLGDSFRLVSSQMEIHRTPMDTRQEFVYCLLQKK